METESLQESIKPKLLKLKPGGRPLYLPTLEERDAAFRAKDKICEEFAKAGKDRIVIASRRRINGHGFDIFRKA